MRRQVGLIGVVITLLFLASTSTGAAFASAHHTRDHRRYADYLQPSQDSKSQCERPVRDRIGGWTCY